MWDLRKLFSTTSTPSTPTVLESLLLAQAESIAQTLKQQQELIAQQQNTLDRIVTAKYDRPLTPAAQQFPSDPMPDWAMNDQGDVREDDIAAALKNLTVESDEAFLAGAK